MGITYKLDTREFDQALNEYAAESKKDWVNVVNTKSMDILFKAGKAAPVAKGPAIRALRNDRSFNLMVTKIIRREFPTGLTAVEFRRMHKQLSTKIINARVSATTYCRSGFYKAANKYKPNREPRPGQQPRKRGKSFSGSLSTQVRKAFPGLRPVTTAEILWSAANDIDARGKKSVAEKAMRQGMQASIADMRVYLRRKAQERADKHSTK